MKVSNTDSSDDFYPKLKSAKLIPTLKGFIIEKQILVWCPFCAVFHVHGWPALSTTVKNHREAHCYDKYIGHQKIQSPLCETGYYIKPFSKTELKKFGIKLDDVD